MKFFPSWSGVPGLLARSGLLMITMSVLLNFGGCSYFESRENAQEDLAAAKEYVDYGQELIDKGKAMIIEAELMLASAENRAAEVTALAERFGVDAVADLMDKALAKKASAQKLMEDANKYLADGEQIVQVGSAAVESAQAYLDSGGSPLGSIFEIILAVGGTLTGAGGLLHGYRWAKAANSIVGGLQAVKKVMDPPTRANFDAGLLAATDEPGRKLIVKAKHTKAAKAAEKAAERVIRPLAEGSVGSPPSPSA